MLYGSELCPAPQSNSRLSDASKELCKSSVSSKSATDPALQAQIAQLKEKAHQSFMQVIQMQQLHDEELQMLREQQAQREQELQARIQQLQERAGRIEQLQVRVQQLQYENSAMEKNNKIHFCEMEDDFSIDNIDIISSQENQDHSSSAHLQQVITMLDREEDFQNAKEHLLSQVRSVLANSNNSPPESAPIFQLTTKLLDYVAGLRAECAILLNTQKEQEREHELLKDTASTKCLQALQKDTKFMTEHIKRLSAEKLRAEKRAAEVERQLRALEEKVKRMESQQKGANKAEKPSNGGSPQIEERDISLELNQFISETFKNSSNLNPIASRPIKAHSAVTNTSNKR